MSADVVSVRKRGHAWWQGVLVDQDGRICWRSDLLTATVAGALDIARAVLRQ